MEFKQSSFEEIVESEKEMVLSGAHRYGSYFANAYAFNILLQEFIKSVNPDRFIFAMFISQIRKHHTLALFSTLRLHHIQAMMDLRQTIEAGACAAFAIANPSEEGFADFNENGLLEATQALTKKRYKWLEENFAVGSEAIKKIKGSINESVSHSNIIYAHNNFRFDANDDEFVTPFFDIEDDYLVKTNLWQIGNIAMGLMDLFYGINDKLDVIKFIESFIPRLKELELANHKLKEEMMTTERYKIAKQRAETKD